MKKIDEHTWFVGSHTDLKPKKNYFKIKIWVAIALISVALIVIWYCALTRHTHG